MTEELKPCPFCGKDLAVNRRKHNPYARCATENCNGGRLPLLNLDQPEDVAAWNTRATLSPAHIEDEREAFNAEYDAICSRPITHREIAWRMWQARAALCPAHIEDGEEVEVVGTLIIGEQGWDNAIELNPGPVMALADAHPKSAMPLMTVAQHQRMTAALVARNEWLEQVAVEAAETEKHALQLADAYRNGAALSAPPAAGAPEGWKLVPIEPSPEMLAAASEYHGSAAYAGAMRADSETDAECYRAMLAATPTPPASEQQMAVVIPERKKHVGESLCSDTFDGWNRCIDEFLRLNPHLAKGEGV